MAAELAVLEVAGEVAREAKLVGIPRLAASSLRQDAAVAAVAPETLKAMPVPVAAAAVLDR